MNTENRIARFMRNSGPARALVPAGIILLVFGLIMLCMNTGSYELTTGRITSVDPGSDKKYDVSFTYTVNGTTYEGSFDDIPGEFTVGGPIDVYYNPEKPGNISNSLPSICNNKEDSRPGCLLCYRTSWKRSSTSSTFWRFTS